MLLSLFTKRIMIKGKPLYALVTAYNEEETIGTVLDVLLSVPEIDFVQVVDDSSTDNTVLEVKKRSEVGYIGLPVRVPVGDAIMAHLDTIPDNAHIMWCDADLRGFKAVHVAEILNIYSSNDVSMVVGLKDHIPFLPISATRWFPSWFLRGWDRVIGRLNLHVGGERVLAKADFIEAIAESRKLGWREMLSGYGIVIFLNWYLKEYKKGYLTTVLPLKGLTHKEKYQKRGFLRGSWAMFRSIYQFLKVAVKLKLCNSR